MTPPIRKNNNGTFWLSEDFYFGEIAKYETKIEELKQIIKRLKDENYTLEEENRKLRKEIVNKLNNI